MARAAACADARRDVDAGPFAVASPAVAPSVEVAGRDEPEGGPAGEPAAANVVAPAVGAAADVVAPALGAAADVADGEGAEAFGGVLVAAVTRRALACASDWLWEPELPGELEEELEVLAPRDAPLDPDPLLAAPHWRPSPPDAAALCGLPSRADVTALRIEEMTEPRSGVASE